MNLAYALHIELLGESWDSRQQRWRDPKTPDLRIKTRGTDPRNHVPWWFLDGILQVKVQQATGAWPCAGPLPRQPAQLVRLIRWLVDTNFLRRSSPFG